MSPDLLILMIFFGCRSTDRCAWKKRFSNDIQLLLGLHLMGTRKKRTTMSLSNYYVDCLLKHDADHEQYKIEKECISYFF